LYITVLYSDRVPCYFYLNSDDIKNIVASIKVLTCLGILLLCSPLQLQKSILISLLTIITTWLVGRCCDTIYTWYHIDIFTVYLFVWQIVSLIHKSLNQDLPYLSFTFHQKASCLYVAFLAFTIYDIGLRFLPTYVNFVLLWMTAAVDMWVCINGFSLFSSRTFFSLILRSKFTQTLLLVIIWEITDQLRFNDIHIEMQILDICIVYRNACMLS
jgi:hypothetical protein